MPVRVDNVAAPWFGYSHAWINGYRVPLGDGVSGAEASEAMADAVAAALEPAFLAHYLAGGGGPTNQALAQWSADVAIAATEAGHATAVDGQIGWSAYQTYTNATSADMGWKAMSRAVEFAFVGKLRLFANWPAATLPAAWTGQAEGSFHWLTSISGRDTATDEPHPWTGTHHEAKLRFATEPSTDMPLGGDSTVRLADTPNKKLSRVTCRLLVSAPEFGDDARAYANCSTWLAKWQALDAVSCRWEQFSSYKAEYERFYLMLLAFLPTGDATNRNLAALLLDNHLRREAAVAVGGISDAATYRDKAPGAPALLFHRFGSWWPLAGMTDAANTELSNRSLAFYEVIAGPWADYEPAADIRSLVHHQGVTTFTGQLTYDLPDTDGTVEVPALDSLTVNDFRSFRWQRVAASWRAGFGLSSIAHRVVGNGEFTTRSAIGDPPRRVKLTMRDGARYWRLWLAHPVPAGPRSDWGSPPNWSGFLADHFSSAAEWIAQHRNVVLWVVDVPAMMAAPTKRQAAFADVNELSGPLPVADDIDASDAHWLFARYGRLFVAWWFSEGYTIETAAERQINLAWPAGGPVPRVTMTLDGGRGAAILGCWQQAQWPSFAAFAAALKASAAAWDGASKTVSATLPTMVETAPNSSASVQLALSWGDALQLDGSPKAAAGAPEIVMH